MFFVLFVRYKDLCNFTAKITGHPAVLYKILTPDNKNKLLLCLLNRIFRTFAAKNNTGEHVMKK